NDPAPNWNGVLLCRAVASYRTFRQFPPCCSPALNLPSTSTSRLTPGCPKTDKICSLTISDKCHRPMCYRLIYPSFKPIILLSRSRLAGSQISGLTLRFPQRPLKLSLTSSLFTVRRAHWLTAGCPKSECIAVFGFSISIADLSAEGAT